MPFKEYNQDQLFLLPPSLHEFLPEGHLARVINEVVDELDLRELRERYSDLGCSAYHPQMMVKVLFYGYAMGERSSRLLAHRLKSDMAYMYLSALQQPDFRTINRFRKDNIDLLKGFFVQIVRFCREMGMISVGTIAMDGTKLKANAAYRKTKRAGELEAEIRAIEGEVEAVLKACEEVDNQEDGQMGEDQSPYESPSELKDKERLREKLKRAKEKVLEEGLKEINLTDPEARTMLHRGYRAEPSYNGQIAVEESHGVIVAATLTNNPADYEALVALVEETEENTGERPLEVLGDSGFSSYENLQYLEEKDIIGYIPDQRMESLRKGTDQHPEFDRSRFQYDEADDRYLCPMGRFLPYKGLLRRKGKPDIKIYRGMDCVGCEHRLECTKAESRSISQDPREFLMERMRTRLRTEQGKAHYGKRKTIVEPVFGDMKFNRKMGGVLLRGKLKARGEFLIICIAHNLRKIAKYLSSTPPEPEIRPLMA
jgi:transposase